MGREEEPFPGLAEAVTRALWRVAGSGLFAEDREDCLVEARLAVWRATQRTAGAPEADRRRYAAAAARHAVAGSIARCRRLVLGVCSIEESILEELSEARARASADGRSGQQVAGIPWYEQLENEDVGKALLLLAPAGHEALTGWAECGSFVELAAQLGVAPDAARKRCHRAEDRVRKLLRDCAGGGRPLMAPMARSERPCAYSLPSARRG